MPKTSLRNKVRDSAKKITTRALSVVRGANNKPLQSREEIEELIASKQLELLQVRKSAAKVKRPTNRASVPEFRDFLSAAGPLYDREQELIEDIGRLLKLLKKA